MTEVVSGDFFRAVEVALERLDSESPLRALIYEQFLDYLATEDSDGARIASLALLGTNDPNAIKQAETLHVRPRLDRLSTANAGKAERPRLDLLILTPKAAEIRACRAVFGLTETQATRYGEDCDVWVWNTHGLTVGLVVIGADGNVETAIEVHRIASHIDFDSAVLVGMAAGLEGEVNKGDVVVATWVFAYEFLRLTKRRHIPRSKAYQADMRSVQKVTQALVDNEEWLGAVSREVRGRRDMPKFDADEPEKVTAKWRPKVKPGVVLAGSLLIEDGSIKKLRDKISDRALAAEMEGAGFAASCSAMRIPWMVFRGIADYGDQDVRAAPQERQQERRRGKSWQFPSTYVAAACVRDFVLTGHLPLIPSLRDRRS